jgi:glycosyltransferase involved in cell wall biosynthesis
MVVPEAQSSGIGVIVSPSAGARDYVEDGVTGLVLSDLTVSSIGSALEKVHDKNILESFSKAARSRMCQYSPLEIVQKQFYSAIFD